MGTFVQVIEDHYGHLKPEMVGDELTVERSMMSAVEGHIISSGDAFGYRLINED
jgi:hypothetical protein